MKRIPWAMLFGICCNGMASANPPPQTAGANPWLTAKLYGHDNDMAALRRVRIQPEAGRYFVTIDNQFGFRCELLFDAAGVPASLKDCVSTQFDAGFMDPDDAWQVREPSISLKCATRSKEVVCRGKYSLVSGDYESRAEMVIARAL